MAVFEEAVDSELALNYLKEQQLFPSMRTSKDWERIDAGIKRRAFFAAGVAKAEILDVFLKETKLAQTGEKGIAETRRDVRAQLKKLGYRPPVDPRDSKMVREIKDLSSDARIDLIINTNVNQSLSYGTWAADQDEDFLYAWPALELVRAGARKVPRPWRTKLWPGAGGKFYGGRMMALRTDPLWTMSKSAGGFNCFGNPYPPFDFNSGMVTDPIDREEAESLGVLPEGSDYQPPPEKGFFGEEFPELPSMESEAIAQAVVESFGTASVLRPDFFRSELELEDLDLPPVLRAEDLPPLPPMIDLEDLELPPRVPLDPIPDELFKLPKDPDFPQLEEFQLPYKPISIPQLQSIDPQAMLAELSSEIKGIAKGAMIGEEKRLYGLLQEMLAAAAAAKAAEEE